MSNMLTSLWKPDGWLRSGLDNQLSLTHHFAPITAASDARVFHDVIHDLSPAWSRQSTVCGYPNSLIQRVSNIDLVPSHVRAPVNRLITIAASPISDERYAPRVMPSFPCGVCRRKCTRCVGEFMLPLILTGKRASARAPSLRTCVLHANRDLIFDALRSQCGASGRWKIWAHQKMACISRRCCGTLCAVMFGLVRFCGLRETKRTYAHKQSRQKRVPRCLKMCFGSHAMVINALKS